MPHEKRQFENGQIYHVVTRRIGNELLFGDEDDYFRGIFSVFEFNNLNPVSIYKRRVQRAAFKKAIQAIEAGRGLTSSGLPTPISPIVLVRAGRGQTSSTVSIEKDKRKPLVEVLAFCLMPNHIHLLIRQIADNGISKFMQKFGNGYAGYFKEKYDQAGRGYFFKNRFVAVPIESDDQLLVVFIYIHTNPIALIEPNWKENGIESAAKVIEFLENEYRWSSYMDYIDKKNFPSVTERKWLLEVIGGYENAKQLINSWVMQKEGLRKMVNRMDEKLKKWKV